MSVLPSRCGKVTGTGDNEHPERLSPWDSFCLSGHGPGLDFSASRSSVAVT